MALLYQRALFGSAQQAFSRGELQETLDTCQRLINLEPWHEEGVLLAMRACQATNDLPGARHYYLELEKRLRCDLNTRPQDELQALYQTLTPKI